MLPSSAVSPSPPFANQLWRVQDPSDHISVDSRSTEGSASARTALQTASRREGYLCQRERTEGGGGVEMVTDRGAACNFPTCKKLPSQAGTVDITSLPDAEYPHYDDMSTFTWGYDWTKYFQAHGHCRLWQYRRQLKWLSPHQGSTPLQLLLNLPSYRSRR